MRPHPIIAAWVGFLLIASTAVAGPGEVSQRLLLAHVMPWYTSRPISGRWGWHWTMNRFDPERVDANGRREIASHHYPLIGPYDSSDPDALECQALLMKFAGIDGAILDWYGIEDFWDYATIHRNAERLIRYLRKAGLQFAVCYEDQSVKHMLAEGHLAAGEAITHGTRVLEWLHRNWFAQDAYVKVGGRPLLLIFGPQHFDADAWRRVISHLPIPPRLYVLPHLSDTIEADGVFGWPPVSGGGEIAPSVWRSYLRNLYARETDGLSVIGVVFPGFHDIYQEAGVHPSLGFLDAREGKTFEETLELAWKSCSRLIQIATWNDYGEGTEIEPTVESGYRYLEAVQRVVRASRGEAFPFRPEHLRLPVMLYELRKRHAGDSHAQSVLDRASALLFSGRCQEARFLLEQSPFHLGG